MSDAGTIPTFSNPIPGSAQENPEDEAGILTDQDRTSPENMRNLEMDDNLGAISDSPESLEDEPSDFMRGEIDVVDQMERAATALDDSLQGHELQGFEDSPKGDLNSSFRDTPGGLEEVAAKTDEDMARHHHPQKKH